MRIFQKAAKFVPKVSIELLAQIWPLGPAVEKFCAAHYLPTSEIVP